MLKRQRLTYNMAISEFQAENTYKKKKKGISIREDVKPNLEVEKSNLTSLLNLNLTA